jgi:hypothetical protein
MFFGKREKSNINFVEKEFAAKILKHTEETENLKLYKIEYLGFHYLNTGNHKTQK